MTLSSRPLAVVIFVVMFGGIGLSSLLGWWQTESTKEPARFTEGEFAGQADPVDIRGSYTFEDIEHSFGVAPEILARAFQVQAEDPASFAVKDLEALYLDSGFEIGTNSVRLFVAFYLGLPFDTAGQEIYLPAPAARLLQEKGLLTPGQQAYLEAHTVDVPAGPGAGTGSAPETEEAPAAPDSGESTSEDYVVKGKTLFGDLVRWGVPQEVIEQIIGGPMPDPAMKVKDYATANGLSFETLKTQLQGEVDKARQ